METSALFSWFNQGGLFLILGALLLFGAVLFLIRVLVLWWNGFFPKKDLASARRPPRLSLHAGLIRLLVALVFVFVSLSLFLAGTTLRSYSAFTRTQRIGILECLEWNPAQQWMVVRFTPPSGSGQTYELRGDQWEISAHILKWDPALNLLGLQTAYRLHQIKGVYQEAADENGKPHQAFALAPRQDWIWWLLGRYGDKLPWVEAVYGNAVSLPARPGERVEVLVALSGLSVRKLEK